MSNSMKAKITIGCDLGRKNGDHTAITALKTNRQGKLIILDVITAKRNSPDHDLKLRAFNLKWHPNFFRRWLFRIFGV